MQHEEFIHKVGEEAEFDDPGKAVDITRAVLGTLGELLTGTGRHHFEAQLPLELKKNVREWQDTIEAGKKYPRLSPEKIINRIQARSGLNHSETIRGTAAVLKVLQGAVSVGELEEIREHLEGLDVLIGEQE